MTLILLGKHPITGEKWWYHTENGLRPFTPEEMDPGMPTIPGLQEYDQILAFVEGCEWPDR
jgi:hypothetical protein